MPAFIKMPGAIPAPHIGIKIPLAQAWDFTGMMNRI